jgi:hypothetical protein
MAAAYRELADDIAREPDLVWKAWTEAPDRLVAGGVYLFETRDGAQAYTAKHAARLKEWGVTDIDVRLFEVNSALSEITGLSHGSATRAPELRT